MMKQLQEIGMLLVLQQLVLHSICRNTQLVLETLKRMQEHLMKVQ